MPGTIARLPPLREQDNREPTKNEQVRRSDQRRQNANERERDGAGLEQQIEGEGECKKLEHAVARGNDQPIKIRIEKDCKKGKPRNEPVFDAPAYQGVEDKSEIEIEENRNDGSETGHDERQTQESRTDGIKIAHRYMQGGELFHLGNPEVESNAERIDEHRDQYSHIGQTNDARFGPER